MFIRPESTSDQTEVFQIHQASFETISEAILVDALRKKASHVVSLVAEDEDDGTLLGHILFTPVQLGNSPAPLLMGLAPMAVRIDRRSRGVGSALVNQGILHCLDLGAKAIVVLGHAQYYPRFGFTKSSDHGIKSEFDVAEDVFMIKELEAGFLKGKTGVIKYHEEFSKFGD